MDSNKYLSPDIKTDDELLAQFFAANMPEMEDNGFTKRVMHRLPKQETPSWLADLWPWLAGLGGVVIGLGYHLWKEWPHLISGMTRLIEDLPTLLQDGEAFLLHYLATIAKTLFTTHAHHITPQTVLMIVVTIVTLISLAVYDEKEKRRLTR
ncbi:putative membrane protein [Prevotella sp. CAG:924]|nr:putative membrane protein [Prevotella sp. CAG:924]